MPRYVLLSKCLVFLCVLLSLGVGTSLIALAGQTDENPPAKSGSRTIESGPSLSSMEKEKGSGGWSYNTEYFFAITKAVRDSSMPAGAKVVVSIFSVPVDLVCAPFAAILGLFGE